PPLPPVPLCRPTAAPLRAPPIRDVWAVPHSPTGTDEPLLGPPEGPQEILGRGPRVAQPVLGAVLVHGQLSAQAADGHVALLEQRGMHDVQLRVGHFGFPGQAEELPQREFGRGPRWGSSPSPRCHALRRYARRAGPAPDNVPDCRALLLLWLFGWQL